MGLSFQGIIVYMVTVAIVSSGRQWRKPGVKRRAKYWGGTAEGVLRALFCVRTSVIMGTPIFVESYDKEQ